MKTRFWFLSLLLQCWYFQYWLTRPVFIFPTTFHHILFLIVFLFFILIIFLSSSSRVHFLVIESGEVLFSKYLFFFFFFQQSGRVVNRHLNNLLTVLWQISQLNIFWRILSLSLSFFWFSCNLIMSFDSKILLLDSNNLLIGLRLS